MAKRKMNLKQTVGTAGIGVVGLGFLAHAIGMLTGWYDLAPIYEMFNIKAETFGWATLSGPAAYIAARVGVDAFKSNRNYKAELDIFNTDRLIDAQTLVKTSQDLANDKLDRNFNIEKENNELMKQIIALEEEKAKKLEEIEARKQAIIDDIEQV